MYTLHMGQQGSAEATGEHRAMMKVVQARQNGELLSIHIFCQILQLICPYAFSGLKVMVGRLLPTFIGR